MLICVFCSDHPDTNETMDTEPVHRIVCLVTPKLLLVLMLPTQRDGQAELTWAVD